MRKVLAIFIIVLASYLVFDKFTNGDNPTENADKEVTLSTVSPSIQSSNKAEGNRVEPEPLYEIDSSNTPATETFNGDILEGVYTAVLNEKHIKANLRFSFYSNKTFKDYRDMTYPKSMAGETTGTYSIDGAILTLNYTEVRDTEVFRFSQAKMSLHKDGTLRTGVIVLTKQ